MLSSLSAHSDLWPPTSTRHFPLLTNAFLGVFSVKPSGGCDAAIIPLDQQQVVKDFAAPVWHRQPSKSLQSPFFPILMSQFELQLVSFALAFTPWVHQVADRLIRYVCADRWLCLIKSHYPVETFHAVSSDTLGRNNFANTTSLCQNRMEPHVKKREEKMSTNLQRPSYAGALARCYIAMLVH